MRARLSVAGLMIVAGLCLTIPTSAGAVPVGLADLAGSFSGTTTTLQSSPPFCDIDTSLPHVFDAAYPGSAAVGVINLHIQGCSNFGSLPVPPPPPYDYGGTFTITTNVGTLSGNAGGRQVTAGEFELALSVQSGTGVFAMTKGTLSVSMEVNSGNPATVTGSVSVASTSVVLPANGATVSGKQTLDAIASPSTNEVQYELTGGGLNGKVIATATPTYFGWLASWDTTTVPNGTYSLQSVASYPVFNSGTTTSPSVAITINNPPVTSVLLPSTGATLSGSTYLDASATNATGVKFLLFGGSFGFNAPTICTATATIYGWLCSWNTTTVPNGSYFLVSEASGAGGSTSSSTGVSVTVNNAPPSTTVVIPASGATLDSAQDTVLDAVASPGVTQVTIQLNVFGSPISYATTPTIYGWIAVLPGTPCNPAHCQATGLPATVQSVASYSGGVSGTSPAVNVTVIVYGGVS